MPREPRTARHPAVPGRSLRRVRSPRSSATASEAEASPRANAPRTGATASAAVSRATRWVPQANLKAAGRGRKLLALAVVLLVLGVSYTNSLRIMLNQQRDLAATESQIARQRAQVDDLNAQLQRWNDPAYIKSEARSQLGWVMQGETGYRVIGLDGKVLTTEGSSSGIATTGDGDQTRWWDRLAGSIQTADSLQAPSR